MRSVWYHHFRAKLLRLIIGARHQSHSRNTGRESKIVFNARRSACLPAEGAAIEHYDLQAFRGSVHRGSQSRGARANDRDVIDLLPIYRPQQADTARELVLA